MQERRAVHAARQRVGGHLRVSEVEERAALARAGVESGDWSAERFRARTHPQAFQDLEAGGLQQEARADGQQRRRALEDLDRVAVPLQQQSRGGSRTAAPDHADAQRRCRHRAEV